MKVINIAQAVGIECSTIEDGKHLHDMILIARLASQDGVELDFQDVEFISTSFLDEAIGELYDVQGFDPSSIRFSNIKPQHRELLTAVQSWAIERYSNTARNLPEELILRQSISILLDRLINYIDAAPRIPLKLQELRKLAFEVLSR